MFLFDVCGCCMFFIEKDLTGACCPVDLWEEWGRGGERGGQGPVLILVCRHSSAQTMCSKIKDDLMLVKCSEESQIE